MPRKGEHFTPAQIQKIREVHNRPETVERHRQAVLGIKRSPEARERNRQAHLTPESIERSRRNFLGKHHTAEANEKNRRAHLGRHHTPESLEKLRLASTGKRFSPEIREKLRQAHNTPEAREKKRENALRLYEDPRYLMNLSKSLHSKTKPEKRLELILESLYPGEFKYNGRFNCGISINRLFPDFVNVNGKKQVIDVHGLKWHEGEDVAIRQARYAKYGYSSLIIWDYELKDEKAVVQKITEFVGMPPQHYFDAQPTRIHDEPSMGVSEGSAERPAGSNWTFSPASPLAPPPWMMRS